MQLFWGIFFIIYAILKLSIGLFVIFASKEKRDEVADKPLIKFIITKDHTIAGTMFELSFMALGIFTFIHGLELLGVIHNVITIKITVIFNILFGLYLFIFYVLVLYTRAPISKDPKFNNYYLNPGLMSGLTAIALAFIILLWANCSCSATLNPYQTISYVLIVLILTGCVGHILFKTQSARSILDILMLILNAF